MKRRLMELLNKVFLYFKMLSGKKQEAEASLANIESARITSTKLKALHLKPNPHPPKPVPDVSVKNLGQNREKIVPKHRESEWAKLSHTRLKALSHYEC